MKQYLKLYRAENKKKIEDAKRKIADAQTQLEINSKHCQTDDRLTNKSDRNSDEDEDYEKDPQNEITNKEMLFSKSQRKHFII